MKKEMVRLSLAPTGWICLKLLNLLLVHTGMKYPYLTDVGKGTMITMRKALDLSGRVRLLRL